MRFNVELEFDRLTVLVDLVQLDTRPVSLGVQVLGVLASCLRNLVGVKHAKVLAALGAA